MPVLFGVFLFMGVSSLRGLQFFERILLLFIPRKYQPDYVYLKFIPLHRVHIFTAIQLAALIGLWLIKNHPQTSISFPVGPPPSDPFFSLSLQLIPLSLKVMLLVICGIRKLIERIFSKRELRLVGHIFLHAEMKKLPS